MAQPAFLWTLVLPYPLPERTTNLIPSEHSSITGASIHRTVPPVHGWGFARLDQVLVILSGSAPTGAPPHLPIGPISPHAGAGQEHQHEIVPETSPHPPEAAPVHPAALPEHSWYSTSDLASWLRVDASTLRRWRTATPPQGPPFVTVSERVILYSALDVETWLRKRRTVPEKGIRGR